MKKLKRLYNENDIPTRPAMAVSRPIYELASDIAVDLARRGYSVNDIDTLFRMQIGLAIFDARRARP